MAVALSGGNPVASGLACDANDETDMAVLRVQSAYLFSDGFESAGTLHRSRTAP
jgi:hypothetical protein